MDHEPQNDPRFGLDDAIASSSDELMANEGEIQPWGPGWSLLWGVIVFSIWTVAQVALLKGFEWFASVRGMAGDGGAESIHERIMSDGDLMGPLVFGSALVGCLVILAVVKVKGTSLATGLGLRLPVWWVWLILPFATVILLMLINMLTSLLAGEQSLEDKAGIVDIVRGTDWLVLLLLGVSVGAPFFEEFLFRGLIHSGLRQSFLGVWGSAIVTAAAFSAIHLQYQDLSAFAFLFLLGIALVAARELTGSLWVPIAMHAIQNAFATIPLFLILNGVIPQDQVPEEMKQLIEISDRRAQEQTVEAEAGAESAIEVEVDS